MIQICCHTTHVATRKIRLFKNTRDQIAFGGAGGAGLFNDPLLETDRHPAGNIRCAHEPTSVHAVHRVKRSSLSLKGSHRGYAER
jgi:hypothetical protein